MCDRKIMAFSRPPPLTLIPCYNPTEPSSLSTSPRSSWSAVILFLMTVFLASICFSSINCVAHAKTISLSSSASAPSHVKTKSCFSTEECKDPHKECVEGKCQCKSFFDYIPEDDSCAKSFGATCTIFEGSDEELCNTNKYLACDETGTCSCHKEGDSLLIYDPNLETCVAPPGHHCEFMSWSNVKKECVPNAKCAVDKNRKVDRNFFGVCECNEGFVPKGLRCVPKLGSKCEYDGDCDQDGMRCLEGKCACEANRFYFENGYECKVKVGETCEIARGDCADHAKCQGARNEMYQWEWQCRCNLGYHEAPENGTCVKDWHDNCVEFKVYDEMRERCSLKVGRSCVPYQANPCVKHAFCGTGNLCQCFDGYDVTLNETCERKNEIAGIGEGVNKNELESFTEAMTMETPVASEHRGNNGQEEKRNTKKMSNNNDATGGSVLFYGMTLIKQLFIAFMAMRFIV